MVLAVRTGIVLSLLGAAQAWPAPAEAPHTSSTSLAAVNRLEPGLWKLDIKGQAPEVECFTDMISLIQVEHEQPGCSLFVIANKPKSATAHYSCQGAGWGRTTIKMASPVSATIHTQGISHNQPFAYEVEAHRVGACPAAASGKPQ